MATGICWRHRTRCRPACWPVQAQFPREMQPPLFGSHYQTIQPFAPHQRMLSRALNGNAGLAGWNLVMLAPDGGLPSLLVAYRWPVTIGLGAVLASALLALRQAARAAKTLIANRAVRDGESAGWRADSAEAAPARPSISWLSRS